MTIRTCDGVLPAQKCTGKCKRILPTRCFTEITRHGNKTTRCDECFNNKFTYKLNNGFFFGDEWDF